MIPNILKQAYCKIHNFMGDYLFLLNLRQPPPTSDPETTSSIDQKQTERIIRKSFEERFGAHGDAALNLIRESHVGFLQQQLVKLPSSFDCLDASQCWMAYWVTHALTLLNAPITDSHRKSLIALLKSCQSPTGGFGGGPYQISHLAPTYGAVNCLCELGGSESLNIIDRPAMTSWLISLRTPSGSFHMHHDGEVDVRGAYCAISVATILNLDMDSIFVNTAEWIAQCQTYEGGFGCVPGLEAHGGYCFCAFAGLCMLGRTDLVDVPRLLEWTISRQMSMEGGFQGRANKLVDSCYSFWVGGLFPLLHSLLSGSPDLSPGSNVLFDISALQDYLLVCCQRTTNSSSGGGGLIDKPGRNVDLYHTCYALSGLSLAQHAGGSLCVQRPEDELDTVDPRFNICSEAASQALEYFKTKPVV